MQEYDLSQKTAEQKTNLGQSTPVSDAPLQQSSSRELADRAETLQKLREYVNNFKQCQIAQTALNTVFGEGDVLSDIMLIGEAPGAHEDREGRPFCGQSGKLLTNILLACNIPRDKVYITNSVFWRPPDNRRPTAEEIELCRPFVEKHIALIKPQIVIMVGNTAISALLPNEERGIGQLRRKFYDYTNKYLQHSIKVTPIYHPSYILRQQSQKKEMWFDMLKLCIIIDQQ